MDVSARLPDTARASRALQKCAWVLPSLLLLGACHTSRDSLHATDAAPKGWGQDAPAADSAASDATPAGDQVSRGTADLAGGEAEAWNDAGLDYPGDRTSIDLDSALGQASDGDPGAGADGTDGPVSPKPDARTPDAPSADTTTAVADVPVTSPDLNADVGVADPADRGPDATDANLHFDANPARDARPGETGASEGGEGGTGPCCGCLCLDPSWSCSRDTCLDSTGHALVLAAEAGFFELAGGSYVAESENRTSPTHRIWYSFQPAQTSPAGKPLAVFFNGGPGSATSTYLFAFNTAPYTLDLAFTGSGKVASNPSSWAQFANLLYIDAPGAGFSYPLSLSDGSQPSAGIDLDRDAACFLRVIVRFLDRHPGLQANPVILVGESYGGTRATLMLDHLFGYQSLMATGTSFSDSDLYNDLLAHFAAVWPQDDPKTISAAKLATQFGKQVLIQPVVAGDAQWNLNVPDRLVCRSDGDSYQCNEASGWVDQTVGTAAKNLTTIAVLHQALGVDPTTIDWLYASARKKAYGRGSGTIISAPEMSAAFGTLGSDDNYLLSLNETVVRGYSSSSRFWYDSSIGGSFLNNLVYVDTFITNAKYDAVVWTPAIAPGLASFTSRVASSVIDPSSRAGIVRPGWIKVSYLPGSIPEPTTREIRFPSYANAGHTVSMRDPANLLADVMQWYANPVTQPSGSGAEAPAARTVIDSVPRRTMVGPVTGSASVRYLGP